MSVILHTSPRSLNSYTNSNGRRKDSEEGSVILLNNILEENQFLIYNIRENCKFLLRFKAARKGKSSSQFSFF